MDEALSTLAHPGIEAVAIDALEGRLEPGGPAGRYPIPGRESLEACKEASLALLANVGGPRAVDALKWTVLETGHMHLPGGFATEGLAKPIDFARKCIAALGHIPYAAAAEALFEIASNPGIVDYLRNAAVWALAASDSTGT